MKTITVKASKIQSADELSDTYYHNGVNAAVRVWDDGKIDIEVSRDDDVGVAKLLAKHGGWEIIERVATVIKTVYSPLTEGIDDGI